MPSESHSCTVHKATPTPILTEGTMTQNVPVIYDPKVLLWRLRANLHKYYDGSWLPGYGCYVSTAHGARGT